MSTISEFATSPAGQATIAASNAETFFQRLPGMSWFSDGAEVRRAVLNAIDKTIAAAQARGASADDVDAMLDVRLRYMRKPYASRLGLFEEMRMVVPRTPFRFYGLSTGA